MQAIRSIGSFVAQVRRKVGMLTALLTQFSSAPRSVQVMMIAALLYGVLPLDLIPDLLPGVGVIDDITVMALLFMLAWRRFVQHVEAREAEEQNHEVRDDVNEAPIEATVRDAKQAGNESRTYVRRRPSTAG